MKNNLSRDIIHIIVRNSDCPAEGVDNALTEKVYVGRMQWTKVLILLLVGCGFHFLRNCLLLCLQLGREYAFTSAILSKDSTLETYNFKTIVIP
jgi:hypothetical protein